ncbi:hypothetical protein [Pontibacter diazotrophicus]|nr:hypothetical protein [Pontibacter diazotrophicus]
MIRKLLLLLTITTFLSCSDSNTDLLDELQAAVDEEEMGENGYNVVELESLTDFEWDTLYFFQAGEDKRAISDAIGFRWEGETVPQLNRRLLFTKDGQVVSYTDYNYMEFPLMVYGCNEDRWVYPRSRSRFATFKYCSDGTTIYPFIPVECAGNLSEMIETGCPEGEGEEPAV